MNLTNICREVNNYFEASKYFGDFKITDKVIDLSELVADASLQEGQYFRIVGSTFNDGVYQFKEGQIEELAQDETFNGAVWALKIPREFLELAEEIQAWNAKYANNEQVNSPFTSESFGGYSYSKGNLNSNNGNDFGTWQNQFKSRLNSWRKI